MDCLRILEIGANEHKNLELFLPRDDIQYSDSVVPSHLESDPRFIRVDGTSIQFPDESFDVVVALDVLEHVPQTERDIFVREICRVSKGITIFSAPFDNGVNARSERGIATYFRTLYGEMIPWQVEHEREGLPLLEDTVRFISTNLSLTPVILPHGSPLVWSKLMRMEMTCRVSIEMKQYWQYINRFYNEVIFERDYSRSPVRCFVVVPKDNICNLQNISERHNGREIEDSDWRYLQDLENSYYNLLRLKLAQAGDVQLGQTYVQMFFNYGNGFSENQSMVRSFDGTHVGLDLAFEFDLSVNAPMEAIRLDPMNRDSVILVYSVIVVLHSGERISLTVSDTNADLVSNSVYFFSTSDPQILFQCTGLTIDRVEVKMKVVTSRLVGTLLDAISEAIASEKENYNSSMNKIGLLEEQKSELLAATEKLRSELFSAHSEIKLLQERATSSEYTVSEMNAVIDRCDETVQQLLEDNRKLVSERDILLSESDQSIQDLLRLRDQLGAVINELGYVHTLFLSKYLGRLSAIIETIGERGK